MQIVRFGGPTIEVAERVGFEPTVEFPRHSLSRRAPSTARTPLRRGKVILAEVRRQGNAGWFGGFDRRVGQIYRFPAGRQRNGRKAGTRLR
jgi:hypothetical protein